VWLFGVPHRSPYGDAMREWYCDGSEVLRAMDTCVSPLWWRERDMSRAACSDPRPFVLRRMGTFCGSSFLSALHDDSSASNRRVGSPMPAYTTASYPPPSHAFATAPDTSPASGSHPSGNRSNPVLLLMLKALPRLLCSVVVLDSFVSDTYKELRTT